jgi:hypothetical protein
MYWHQRKVNADTEKNGRLEKLGVILIRLREAPLTRISEHDLVFATGGIVLDDVKALLRNIKKIANLRFQPMPPIEQYLSRREWSSEGAYLELLERLPGPIEGNSLAEVRPDIASEWHPTANKNLLPSDVAAKSNMRIWWQCKNDASHVWRAAPLQRVGSETGCPFCSGSRASKGYNLKLSNPGLAMEWHLSKNRELTPTDVTPVSGKKVWWQCPVDPSHEWLTNISNRARGAGCPFCKGRRPLQLTVEQILGWADAEFAATRKWPTSRSGALLSIPSQTWGAINSALVSGRRGLAGGSSLSDLLERERNVVRGPRKRNSR